VEVLYNNYFIRPFSSLVCFYTLIVCVGYKNPKEKSQYFLASPNPPLLFELSILFSLVFSSSSFSFDLLSECRLFSLFQMFSYVYLIMILKMCFLIL